MYIRRCLFQHNIISRGGDEIIVCPGTYTEPTINTRSGQTIKSYTQDPSDPFNDLKNAIVKAASPDQNVFFVYSWASSIIGFTITGATGNSCDIGADNMPPPCAGIRVYCAFSGYFKNNVITGNNHGIIIKDTAPDWLFYFDVSTNDIYSNDVGIMLFYGRKSTIWNNYIHDNYDTGVVLLDTKYNTIEANTIELNGYGTGNGYGIDIASINYNALDNVIFHNNIIDNADQVYDDNPYSQFWHNETLQQGNYWSDYTGVDLDNPPDGIGDTNIPWPDKGFDNYPLINPFVNPSYTLRVYVFSRLLTGPYDLSTTDIVASTPPGINCGTDCREVFGDGTEVVLTATPEDTGYVFKGWSGDTCTGADDCTFMMNDHSTVFAYFQECSDPPARLDRTTPVYYPSIQEAYNQSVDGDVIQSRLSLYPENLNFNLDKSVTMEGGYDCNYIAITGKTRINGDMIISNGTITIGDFVLE